MRAGVELRQDVGQVVFRNREDHRDRLQLRDDGDAGAVGRLHVIARIDQAQPDAAGHRRDDVAIDDVELLLIDLRLVELHRALVLLHDVDLILVLLAGDRILLGQFLVALEIDLRLREQALIVRELAFVLGLQRADRGAGRSAPGSRPS